MYEFTTSRRSLGGGGGRLGLRLRLAGGLLSVATFAMLVHEVVRRELGPAGLARVVVQRRAGLRLAVPARPGSLWRVLPPGHVEDPSELHGSITRCYVEYCVALTFWRVWSLDALDIQLAGCR